MKSIIFRLFLLLLAVNVSGQKMDNDIYCYPDTVLIEYREGYRHIQKPTVVSFVPYRAVLCEKCSKIGVRLEVGVSSFHYNKNTKYWIGNHVAPNFNFIFTYDKFNFGFRFKPFTVNPQKELLFDNKTLRQEALLNPIKLDFYLGYSFDFKHLSIEPYFGLSHNNFVVINQRELNETFSIPSATGFINGITVNKYFKTRDCRYITIFSNVGYSIIDYKKVHNELGANYFEWTLGVALKGFFMTWFMQKTE
jgi:hypothetical protein